MKHMLFSQYLNVGFTKKEIAMMSSVSKNTKIFLVVAVLCHFPNIAYAQNGHILQTLNKAMTGIIKAAGNVGVQKACEAALPVIFCEVVVDPVLSAIYDDVPFLKPKKDDTLEQIKQKADFAIRHLEENEKYQKMMVSNFMQIKEGQQAILIEINKLGATQLDIQRSIQSILLQQLEIKDSVGELVEKQRKEESREIYKSRTEVLALWYKARNLVDKKQYLLELLKVRGVTRTGNLYDVQFDRDMLVDAKKDIDSSDVTIKSLEDSRLSLNRYIIVIEETINFLEEDLAKN